MPSPLLVALEAHLLDYEADLIVVGKQYFQYSRLDHVQAIAYNVLCTAALEHFVEKRCLEIAELGLRRLLDGQPSSTGKALIVWYIMREGKRSSAQIPIQKYDISSTKALNLQILECYSMHVEKNHGVASEKLQNLVFPLGIRENQVPIVLTQSLDVLVDYRNKNSHTYQNRRRSLSEPSTEIGKIAQVLQPLRKLDSDLQHVAETFPLT